MVNKEKTQLEKEIKEQYQTRDLINGYIGELRDFLNYSPTRVEKKAALLNELKDRQRQLQERKQELAGKMKAINVNFSRRDNNSLPETWNRAITENLAPIYGELDSIERKIAWLENLHE